MLMIQYLCMPWHFDRVKGLEIPRLESLCKEQPLIFIYFSKVEVIKPYGEVFCFHMIHKDINKKEESSSEVLLCLVFFLIIPQKYLKFRVLSDTGRDYNMTLSSQILALLPKF